jgi:predicted ATPase
MVVGQSFLPVQLFSNQSTQTRGTNKRWTIFPCPPLANYLKVREGEFTYRLLLNSLKDFLRDKQTLLLLDNFEQIISVGPVITELLEACANIKILITSREVLRLRGEDEFPLTPLALPGQSAFKNLLQYPGIALFIERVQAIQLDFQLTPDNAYAVAEICAHLDGLPLAIELAAARIKLLPPIQSLIKVCWYNTR